MLPDSVRYIKNGTGGKWWESAQRDNQLHAGWDAVPQNLLLNPANSNIRALCANTQDYNALITLIDRPSQHVWITFEDDCMWWCLVQDGPKALGPSTNHRGHFYLRCAMEHPWSNCAPNGRILSRSDLPGPIDTVANFKGAVCKPGGRQYDKISRDILRIIKGEENPLVAEASERRASYQASVEAMVVELHWKDFELLVSLMLGRMGWVRVSELGKTRESLDLDVENLMSEERAFVQIKSSASTDTFLASVEQFKAAKHFARMVFAVHSPDAIISTTLPNVHVWQRSRIAELTIRVGLADWLANKLS